MVASNNATCPCMSGRPYRQCCAALLDGDANATDAETLMRSRYSAYVLHRDAYLLVTWHPSTRPTSMDLADDATRWLGLRIVAFREQDADHATVEFVARYRVGGSSAMRLHEVSRFVREDRRWYYRDGRFPSAGADVQGQPQRNTGAE